MSLSSCPAQVFPLLGTAGWWKTLHIPHLFLPWLGRHQLEAHSSLCVGTSLWDCRQNLTLSAEIGNLSFFFQNPVSFADVAVYFSSAEWALLDPRQRCLYESVVMDNYESVTFVGKAGPLGDRCPM